MPRVRRATTKFSAAAAFSFWMALGLAAAVYADGATGGQSVGAAVAEAAAGSSHRDQPSAKLPPLVVDKEHPLKLVDKAIDRKMKVDNSACYVCHGNFEDEPMVVVHGQNEVGCIKCHGESLDHRDDEDNVTPPEIMYPREKIDASCKKCHDTHDAPAKEVLARWQKRCPQQSDFEKIVCTDCHGKHRMAKRTVRWNKKTRELIIQKVETTASAGGPHH